MWNISVETIGHLADASIRALGLAFIAFVALAILRARHAAARHAVWSAVLIGMLALPVLAPLVPAIAVRMFKPETPVTFVSSSLRPNAPTVSHTAPAKPPAMPSLPAWPMAVAGVYLAVVATSLARVFWAWRTCRRLVHRSAAICDANGHDVLGDLAATQSMAWPLPQLRVSNSVAVPMTVGYRAPAILLPGNWQTWDAWKLRAVLAHELAHIRRGDWLISLAASVNRSVYWFHPLAWWLERHLAMLAEQASDDAALGHLNDAPRYAGTVLEFARVLQNGRRLNYGVAMARTAKVSRRIDRILALRQPGPGAVTPKTWIAIAACALPLVYGAAALQVAQAPSAHDVQPGLAQLLTEGSKLTAAQAQQIEDQLARDPEDLAARGKLIQYYIFNAIDHPRLEHVHWLIQHHPEAEITTYFSLNFLWSHGGDAEYEQEKVLWLGQVAEHPNNAPVLANAARFLGEKDESAAKDLLERARQADPSNPVWLGRLADMMSRAIEISMRPGPVYSSSRGGEKTLVDKSFGEAARTELESSSDAGLVGTVGEFLSGGPGQRPSPAQLELAEHLLTRAQALDPSNQEWPAALERLHVAKEDTSQPDVPKGTVRIRVGGNVQQSNLIEKPVPVYPIQAKQQRIQGLVRFNVVIGKDGHIKGLSVVSGHPLLIPAAQEAVKQWVYRPTLLNGDPVEVATVIDVQFTLSN